MVVDVSLKTAIFKGSLEKHEYHLKNGMCASKGKRHSPPKIFKF